VTTSTASATVKRIFGAILLAAMPFLLLAGVETHLGHGTGDGESRIFADASHAGQTNHWEVADSVVTSRCLDCLAPAQPLETAPSDARRLLRNADGTALTVEGRNAPDPDTRRGQRPRAPPS